MPSTAAAAAAAAAMQGTRSLGLAVVKQLKRCSTTSLRLGDWRTSVVCSISSSTHNPDHRDQQHQHHRHNAISSEKKRAAGGGREGWGARGPGLRRRAAAAAPKEEEQPPIDSDKLTPPVERCEGCGVLLQTTCSDAPGFLDPRRLAKSSADSTRAQQEGVVAEDDVDSLADELRDLGLDFMLEDREPANGKGVEPHGSQPLAGVDDELDKMIAQANSELMSGGGAVGKEGGDGDGDEEGTARKEEFIFCARCFSLRHYGKAYSSDAEDAVPDFDFAKIVGRKLRYSYQHRRAVFLVVVDITDFDGSFPTVAVNVLAEALDAVEGSIRAARNEKKGRLSKDDEELSYNFPHAVLVLTKVDLLPSQVRFSRVENWARRQWRQLCPSVGLRAVAGISNKNGYGLDDLSRGLSKLAGSRGDVWVVGSQNAGKSSLINALSRVQKHNGRQRADDFFLAKDSSGKKKSSRRKSGSKSGWAQQNDGEQLTEAPMPGTTLGMVELRNILRNNIRLIDTPGLLQKRQLTARLNIEDVKKTLPSSKLVPRTYRIMEGYSVHIGGLARADVVRINGGRTCYLTIWASRLIPLHMGKTENAADLFNKHCGTGNLSPPSGEDRYLGDDLQPVASGIVVSGERWDISETDVSIGGVGWIGVGMNGSVELDIYSYEGVHTTVREALIPDMAQALERKGFSNRY